MIDNVESFGTKLDTQALCDFGRLSYSQIQVPEVGTEHRITTHVPEVEDSRLCCNYCRYRIRSTWSTGTQTRIADRVRRQPLNQADVWTRSNNLIHNSHRADHIRPV